MLARFVPPDQGPASCEHELGMLSAFPECWNWANEYVHIKSFSEAIPLGPPSDFDETDTFRHQQ
jgi:hypothetical protein